MKFRRGLELQSNLNLVPMVDVVFQLVLFFLVSTTFILAPGIKLQLPVSGTSESIVQQQIMVTVVSPTELYLNKDRYASVEDLEAAVAAIPADDRKQVQSVIVEADESSAYGLMVQVLDVLRRNDLKNVGLRTRDAGS
jgi:biopolymer transport protein ExbD